MCTEYRRGETELWILGISLETLVDSRLAVLLGDNHRKIKISKKMTRPPIPPKARRRKKVALKKENEVSPPLKTFYGLSDMGRGYPHLLLQIKDQQDSVTKQINQAGDPSGDPENQTQGPGSKKLSHPGNRQ